MIRRVESRRRFAFMGLAIGVVALLILLVRPGQRWSDPSLPKTMYAITGVQNEVVRITVTDGRPMTESLVFPDLHYPVWIGCVDGMLLALDGVNSSRGVQARLLKLSVESRTVTVIGATICKNDFSYYGPTLHAGRLWLICHGVLTSIDLQTGLAISGPRVDASIGSRIVAIGQSLFVLNNDGVIVRYAISAQGEATAPGQPLPLARLRPKDLLVASSPGGLWIAREYGLFRVMPESETSWRMVEAPGRYSWGARLVDGSTTDVVVDCSEIPYQTRLIPTKDPSDLIVVKERNFHHVCSCEAIKVGHD